MTDIGYCRVSTQHQSTDDQVDRLKAAGCIELRIDVASGGKWDRPELQTMLTNLSPGDVVVVTRLDRLSRSLKDMLVMMERIKEAGAGFRSLSESIDTTTPAGVMMMSMIGAFAEFERAIIRERTLEGLAAAKRAGKKLGRPPALTGDQKKHIVALVLSGEHSASAMARLHGVAPSTVTRLVKRERERMRAQT